MLTFESEFTTLIKDLWTLNKSISNPNMRRDIGRILTLNVPKYDLQLSADATAAVRDLQQAGFHMLPKLSPEALAEINGALASLRLSGFEADYDTSVKTPSEFFLKDRPENVFLAGYKLEDIIRLKPLVRLVCDENIVSAIASHIGCTPTISAFQVWHTFPGKKELAAEVFHRDRDCFNFVKLFVYLTDVDATAGPHQFIQFSQNPIALQNYLKSEGINTDLGTFFEGNSRNLKLNDLEKVFGENIKTFTAPAGTTFLEETYGLHRGTRPTTSSRLIFSATYTGLPLRFASDNDRVNEMHRKVSFAEAGLPNTSELEKYLFRYLLH